jgi:hypothetical protein
MYQRSKKTKQTVTAVSVTFQTPLQFGFFHLFTEITEHSLYDHKRF